MRILGKIFATFLILLFFRFTAPSTADIISVKIRSHNRDMILFSEFEYSHTGYVSVAVSSVGISSIPVTSNLSQPDPSRIGFFLLSDELSARYDHEFEQNPDLCALDIKFISVLFTFRDLSPPPQSSFNKSYNVTYPGKYLLYFANCNDLSLVTMDVRTELYNTDEDGTTKDYLSAGLPHPSLFFRLILMYLCFLVVWIYISLKNQQCFKRIHLLMGVLLVITLVYFLCAMADQHDLQVTGSRHGWHTWFNIFQFMRNLLFFTLIVMIGAGWCIWKPFLQGCEIFTLIIVILLKGWANLTFISIVESGPYNKDWLDLIDKFRFIDVICCLVVFIHTFSVALAAASAAFKEEEATDKDTSMSMSMSFTRQIVFAMLVLFYIVYSSAANIPLESTARLETGNYVFYVLMFCMYRPFLLEDNDEDLNCKGFLDHTGV
ncbi:hypothetical protein Lser_V15G14800 [Lactuca serriola]